MHLRYYDDDDASLLTELKSAKEDWGGHLIRQDNDVTKTLMDIVKNVACNSSMDHRTWSRRRQSRVDLWCINEVLTLYL